MNHPDAYFRRKLYTFLQLTNCPIESIDRLPIWADELTQLKTWWDEHGKILQNIAKSSDRVGLHSTPQTRETLTTCHLISGQKQNIDPPAPINWDTVLAKLPTSNPKTAFQWLWRFYPDELAKQNPAALLYPADRIIPDCPHHSYIATVTAITGAMFPADRATDSTTDPDRPYILLFSFSPVQDFIKASRKFVDFWAGSYLLHYLSARLCWYLAQHLGADAAIVPSLWNQEIIDAFLDVEYSFWSGEDTPSQRFNTKTSTSLVTAGFPNAITVLVSERHAATLGQALTAELKQSWSTIAEKVRHAIREATVQFLNTDRNHAQIQNIIRTLAISEGINPDTEQNPNEREITKLKACSNWQWSHLWNAQINHTWEPYWTAIPLGDPETPLQTDTSLNWYERQDAIVPPPPGRSTLSDAEIRLYGDRLNVGTWWSNAQTRAHHSLQAIKTNRVWAVPAAPGLRSTISGQFSAVHPFLNYQHLKDDPRYHHKDFREGAGISSGSMRLFWRLMAEVFPGLFDGSEMLNALELTKRMAWAYGDMAQTLGVDLTEDLTPEAIPNVDRTALVDLRDESAELPDAESEARQIDYEKLIRFPNLSSIAAARFIHTQFQQPANAIINYWRILRDAIVRTHNDDDTNTHTFTQRQRRSFFRKTRRPTQCPKTDTATDLDPNQQLKRFYNGTMFSSRWLADDMSLDPSSPDQKNRLQSLRKLVEDSHRQVKFNGGSPSDWWAIVLADGDSMGQYVAGTQLKPYGEYIIHRNAEQIIDRDTISSRDWEQLLATTKRMTPATHVGLNRALLDFSNRLVPYLTEQRYCGRVVYSGGDDVMVVLPLEDLPGFLRSLRAAWCGGVDPGKEFTTSHDDASDDLSDDATAKQTGYWYPKPGKTSLPDRPYFTMGKHATMSAGIVIANKAVPLPTVLNNLWEAEGQRAKKIAGKDKDGLCFRVVYGNGNVLEALMKGSLLDDWWAFVTPMIEQRIGSTDNGLSPLLYRLAEELPQRCCFERGSRLYLFAEAAKVIADRREAQLPDDVQPNLIQWIERWQAWAGTEHEGYWERVRLQAEPGTPNPRAGTEPNRHPIPTPIGIKPEDLSSILRFTAFWLDKMAQRHDWHSTNSDPNSDAIAPDRANTGGDAP